jgi:hypothetical protein
VNEVHEQSTVLIICPLEHERDVLRRALGSRASDFRWIVSGPGGASVRRALEREAPSLDRNSLVILAGCAGGLMAGAGPISIANEVIDATTPTPDAAATHRDHRRWLRPSSVIDDVILASDDMAAMIDRRPIVGVDDVVATVEAKRSLCVRTGGVIADMESHAFADLATERAITWCVLRGVSDGHTETLPHGCETWIDNSGRTRLWRVLFALARGPWTLRAIIRLGSNTKRALRGVARVIERIAPQQPQRGPARS